MVLCAPATFHRDVHRQYRVLLAHVFFAFLICDSTNLTKLVLIFLIWYVLVLFYLKKKIIILTIIIIIIILNRKNSSNE